MKTAAQAQREDRRAKELEEETLMKLARRRALEAFERIISVATDDILRMKDPKTYLHANNLIIERAYGKAAQAVNLGDDKGGPLQISVNIVRSKPREDAES